jgi:hypothetical protein
MSGAAKWSGIDMHEIISTATKQYAKIQVCLKPGEMLLEVSINDATIPIVNAESARYLGEPEFQG